MTPPRRRDPDLPAGIRRRHARGCPATVDGDRARCDCRPTFQAQAGPRTDRRTRSFVKLADAKRWRAKIELELVPIDGSRRAWAMPTVREMGERWLAAAADGRALTRSGTPYREATLRGYRRDMRGRVYARLGDRRLDVVSRGEVLALIGSLQSAGLSPTAVRNAIVPLRALYRYAGDHDITTRNPTRGVAMPGVSASRRERFATPDEFAALLAALPDRDRGVWATAGYAGLRRGELQGLRWDDVNLDGRLIRVRQAWSQSTRTMGIPKSTAGHREIPIAGVLLPYLASQRAAAAAAASPLVFARGTLAGAHRGPGEEPFSDQTLGDRAARAWRAAALAPLGLHEARHTFASMILAAGASMKEVSVLLGHTSIQTTLDIYAHLQPDATRTAVDRLDAFLAA